MISQNASIDLPQGWKPKFGYTLTVREHPREKGKFLAIMADGNPQLGLDEVTVLTLEVFEGPRCVAVKSAKLWFKKMKREMPWIRRQ